MSSLTHGWTGSTWISFARYPHKSFNRSANYGARSPSPSFKGILPAQQHHGLRFVHRRWSFYTCVISYSSHSWVTPRRIGKVKDSCRHGAHYRW